MAIGQCAQSESASCVISYKRDDDDGDDDDEVWWLIYHCSLTGDKHGRALIDGCNSFQLWIISFFD